MLRVLKGRLFYAVVLGLAALANVAGYVFSLWHDETVFDEIVHLFSTFAVISAIGKAAVTAGRLAPSATFFISLVALAVVLGVLWEAFEWLIGIIGGRHDTLMDLAMDTLGAVFAALLINGVFANNAGSGHR